MDMSEIDYDEWEEKCKKFRLQNEGHLKIFEKYLVKDGLSKRTIQKHIAHADTYINDYLLYYDAVSMEDGIADIFEFSSFFIRKCAWSSPNNFKETIASLKKFYKCMLEHGKIKSENYKKLEGLFATRF